MLTLIKFMTYICSPARHCWPQLRDSCQPCTSSILSSCYCSYDGPNFPQPFIFNNKLLSTDNNDYKAASARNSFVPSEGWPVTQDLNQQPSKLSRPVKAVHYSIQWTSPSTFWLPCLKFSVIFTSGRHMPSYNSAMGGPQPQSCHPRSQKAFKLT